jgi:MOSC domain-containing protein YiiM
MHETSSSTPAREGTASQPGVVLAVCVSPGGIPKHPVREARVIELGLEGDKQRFELHGGVNRAVCLFSIEDYAKLARDGVGAKAPGAYGENVLTQGLDYAHLRAGDRLQIGDGVLLEIHDVREPCKTLRSIDARFPDLLLGRSGFLCKVLRTGVLRPGMLIAMNGTAR